MIMTITRRVRVIARRRWTAIRGRTTGLFVSTPVFLVIAIANFASVALRCIARVIARLRQRQTASGRRQQSPRCYARETCDDSRPSRIHFGSPLAPLCGARPKAVRARENRCRQTIGNPLTGTFVKIDATRKVSLVYPSCWMACSDRNIASSGAICRQRRGRWTARDHHADLRTLPGQCSIGSVHR